MTKTLKTLFIFTLLGVMFSGYLSAVKLFTDTCAFSESCPYFLGYPACWYGFGMFLIMFVAVCLGLWGKVRAMLVSKITLFVSVLGIIFAGNFAIQEVMQSTFFGILGFSTCVYGLIFYILIFIISIISLRQKN